MRLLPFACLFILLAGVPLRSSAADPASLPTYRFDMGFDTSPVAAGFLRVTPETHYSPDRKYGWESRDQTAFDVPRPAEDPSWHEPAGQVIPQEFLIFKEHTDVTRGGVSSR